MRDYPEREGLMADAIRWAFASLPAHCFPMTIEASDTLGNVVWTQEVTDPTTVRIPALHRTHGPCGVRFTMANGHIEEVPPPRGWS